MEKSISVYNRKIEKYILLWELLRVTRLFKKSPDKAQNHKLPITNWKWKNYIIILSLLIDQHNSFFPLEN